MPIGAGFAPAGSFPAGYGVPDSAHVPIDATLPALKTSLPSPGRYVDQTTKSYAFTADGRVQGMGNVNQLVLLAITTVRGSSVLPNLGQTFSLIKEKGTDFKRQVASAINLALSDLVKRSLIRVVSIDVQEPITAPDAAIVNVKWQDVTTGVFDTTTIGL